MKRDYRGKNMETDENGWNRRKRLLRIFWRVGLEHVKAVNYDDEVHYHVTKKQSFCALLCFRFPPTFRRSRSMFS